MEFNFNDYTDTVAKDGTPARTEWRKGIEIAFNDWKNRPNFERTTTSPTASPIEWSIYSGEHTMDVGFYHETLTDPKADFAYVRFYEYGGGPPLSGCPTMPGGGKNFYPLYARVYLNHFKIHNKTPGWFFETIIRHELGHVFGLCHAAARTGDPTQHQDEKSASYHSVMFLPSMSDVDDWQRDGIRIDASARWSARPPSGHDYGLADCPFNVDEPTAQQAPQGSRCVFGR